SADGAIYAIRRSLYRKPPEHVNDDFVISASVVRQGRRLVFEPEAIAFEPPMGRAGDEFRRKVRILSRGWWSVLAVRSLLNPFRHGFYSLTFLSHKILRRLTPLFFLGTYTGSLLLAPDAPAYGAVALAQTFFLGLAAVGAWQRHTATGRARILALPFFFCLANAAALAGLLEVLRGRKVTTWQPGGRAEPTAAFPEPRSRRRRALRRAALFVGLIALSFGVGVVQHKLGSLMLPVLGIATAVVAGALFLYPRIGAVLFVALAFANVPVLVGRNLGNPWVVGAVASGLVALPAFVQIYVLRRGWILDQPFLLMLGFLGTLLLSMMVARDHGVAAAWIGTFLVEGLLMYVLMVNAIRRPGVLRASVWTLAIVATILTGLGVYQEIAHDYTNDFGGLAQRKLKRWDPSEGGDAGLFREKERISAADRIGGPVNDPNHFAQLLIIVLPLSFAMIWSERSRFGKVTAFGLTMVVLGGVMLTYSRGAFLVLMGLVGLVTALGYLRWRQVAVAALAVLALTAVVAPGYFDRMDTIRRVTKVNSESDDWKSGDHAMRGRLTEMFAAIHVFIDHPLVGVGPGQYTPYYSLEYMNKPGVAFKQLDVERRAHTLYMELAAETGLLGLMAFLSIAGVVLLRLWVLRRRWLHTRPEYAHLATGLALAILGYLGTGLFLSLAFQRYYWMLIALGGVAGQVLADAPEPA
ncbi:MAG TPA: O-antigen ligase family protein, partial [bacterium]|nr:O-antigen ligase family protein [bacterium]